MQHQPSRDSQVIEDGSGLGRCSRNFWLMRMAAEFPHTTGEAGRLLSANVTAVPHMSQAVPEHT
eukprot:1159644-Pelagomonas_calceolata.AAC.2